MSPQYGELGPLTAEICWRVWGTPANFKGFACWLRYCTDVAQRRSTKLRRMFGRLLGWYTIYTFLGALAPNVILPDAKFTLRPSLAFSCIGSIRLLHDTPAAGVSQTARNGITELSQTAPPIFGWAAITLGIGQHSSW